MVSEVSTVYRWDAFEKESPIELISKNQIPVGMLLASQSFAQFENINNTIQLNSFPIVAFIVVEPD